MTGSEFAIILVSCLLGSSGLMGFLFWVITRRIEKRDKDKADIRFRSETAESEKEKLKSEKEKQLCDRIGLVEIGTKALLHNELYQATSMYLAKKYCSQSDKANLEMLAKPYFEMKMNDVCKRQYEECMSLPNCKESKRKSAND